MKYAVDRIEGELVVLENIESGEIVHVNIKEINADIHEGSILKYSKSHGYTVDVKTENSRREDFRSRLEKLKNLKKWDEF